MTRPDSLRAMVLACIDAHPVFITGRQVSEWTGLDYKTTIDALQALHNQALILRSGRKFSAKWGSVALVRPPSGWQALAAAWYGRGRVR